jgi:hypothetical protein
MTALENELNTALSGNSKHNVVSSKNSIINSSVTAMAVAEPILFDIYGKENIIRQKPYNLYHIRNYWIMEGSLPEGFLGGTFQIIIDDRDCKVIEITHGK